MKVLVACEFSGRVRDAFTALGHTAASCDLQEGETRGVHIVGDIQRIKCDFSSFDLLIAHPPCTYLAASGARWRKPDQIVQPWWFGDGETKATCWWLKGLPLLVADRIVEGRRERVHRMPETKDRWKHRSRTPPGMARAMAEQWGSLTPPAAAAGRGE